VRPVVHVIITTTNEFVGKIHDRMPAPLTPYQFDSWLSGGAGPELLRPWDQGSLPMYPVSRRVNSSKAAGHVQCKRLCPLNPHMRCRLYFNALSQHRGFRDRSLKVPAVRALESV